MAIAFFYYLPSLSHMQLYQNFILEMCKQYKEYTTDILCPDSLAVEH